MKILGNRLLFLGCVFNLFYILGTAGISFPDWRYWSCILLVVIIRLGGYIDGQTHE